MDRSSCHVVCTGSHRYRPPGSIWLPGQYPNMTMCSDELPGPPAQSFIGFLLRTTQFYFAFLLEITTTGFLVFFWYQLLSPKELYRHIRATQRQYPRTTQPERIFVMTLFVFVPALCLIIYIWLPSDLRHGTYLDTYPGRIWWELFYTAVLVLSLPSICPLRI
jgi:hypothetical protein